MNDKKNKAFEMKEEDEKQLLKIRGSVGERRNRKGVF